MRTDELPVSIYFMWPWWEKHYQGALGRPLDIEPDWLDATYLGRQRFLHEVLGEFGVGAEEPSLDTAFLSKVMPFHTVIVPVALGMNATVKETGGYHWQSFSAERMLNLKAVDIADTSLAELLASERNAKLSRYGVATPMIDLGSVTNNAFMLRGPEFYADLIADKALAGHYLAVIRETMCMAYRFIRKLFGPADGFPLSNCNVNLMGPRLYAEMVREYDIQCVEYAARLMDKPPCCNLHHCNVKVDAFAEAYRAIPGLRCLQASHLSDINGIHRVLPDVSFSAMVNPVEFLTKPPEQLDEELDACIAGNPCDLAIWDIDAGCGPSEMQSLFRRLEQIAASHDRKAVFTVIPITWEELDWEFPCYRGGGEVPGAVLKRRQ